MADPKDPQRIKADFTALHDLENAVNNAVTKLQGIEQDLNAHGHLDKRAFGNPDFIHDADDMFKAYEARIPITIKALTDLQHTVGLMSSGLKQVQQNLQGQEDEIVKRFGAIS